MARALEETAAVPLSPSPPCHLSPPLPPALLLARRLWHLHFRTPLEQPPPPSLPPKCSEGAEAHNCNAAPFPNVFAYAPTLTSTE